MIGAKLKSKYFFVSFICLEHQLRAKLLEHACKGSIVPCSRMSTERKCKDRAAIAQRKTTIVSKHSRGAARNNLMHPMYSHATLSPLPDIPTPSQPPPPASPPPSLPPLPASPPPSLPPLPASPPPSSPPLPASPPPTLPPLPLSTPPGSPKTVSPPPASALPKPDAALLGKKITSSSNVKYLHFEVDKKISPELLSTTLNYCRPNTNSCTPEYFIDKMPSKVYISEPGGRSRHTALQHKYSFSSPASSTQSRPSYRPSKNLVSNSSVGCMRTHYSWNKKPPSPELITLSDDEEIQCIREVKKDPSGNASKKLKKKIEDDSICVLPMDNISVSTIPLPPSCKRSRLPSDARPSKLTAGLSPTSTNDSRPCISSSHFIANEEHLASLDTHSASEPESILTECNSRELFVHQKTEIASSMNETSCIAGLPLRDVTDSNFSDLKMENDIRNSPRSSEETQAAFQSNVIKGLDEVDPEYWPLERVRLDDITNHSMDFSDDVLSTRRKLENLRQWRSTGFSNEWQRTSGRGDAVFTLMSYNVLAQKLLTGNMYLYANCDSEHLDWHYRWTLLQHEIKHINADILTFQEVQSNHYHEYFLPWFTHLGYQGTYKKRTGDKYDGCAIFFRSSKFEMVESTSVEFCQPNTFLDRDNVGLICSLVCKHNNAPICIATTHLLYNPKRHDIKLAQLQLFLAEIERIAYSGRPYGPDASPYIPLILTGDMNAYPYQSVINFLKQSSIYYYGLDSKSLTPLNTGGRILSGFLLPRELGVTESCQHAGVLALRETQRQCGTSARALHDQRARELGLLGLYHSERQPTGLNVSECFKEHFTGHLQHPFHLKSVFKHSLDRLGGVPEVTAQVNDWQTVDYILYSQVYSNRHQRAVEGRLKLMARYDLLSGPEARQFGPLPSAVSPSDHFPLAAQFLLRGAAN